MLCRYVALVSEAREVQFPELVEVAAALQKQVTRDFGPVWGVRANVSAYADLGQVPLDYWPIVIKSNLARPEAAGYHEDDLGEPCALVRLTDDWSVTASHEMLEMLADPWGRHLVAGQSPQDPKQRVKFLVEVCDPCSDENYRVNGVAVSDFYTPNYFDPVATSSVTYSYKGAIKEPRQVLKGGYLTWHDTASRTWWRRDWFDDAPKDAKIDDPGHREGQCPRRHRRAFRPDPAQIQKGPQRRRAAGSRPQLASFARTQGGSSSPGARDLANRCRQAAAAPERRGHHHATRQGDEQGADGDEKCCEHIHDPILRNRRHDGIGQAGAL